MEKKSSEQSVGRPPQHFKEVGGSNYVMYNVGSEYLSGDLNAWFKPGVLQPVVATFHQQKKEDVRAQLQAMHASGQRKIAILMWHDHLTPAQLETGGIYGHVLASNGGALLPQHAENLKGLLALVRQSGGFNELVFRFATQGDAWPDRWAEWKEDQYRENFDFIVSVRQLVNEAMNGSGMKVTFDLGAELGGIEVGCTAEYTRRVWEEYVRLFGPDDTFGFSIAAHPGRIARWIEVCDKTGVRPSSFALDLYDYIPEWMPLMVPEFRKAGIDDPQIIVLETYYNDPQSLKALQDAAEKNNIEYLYLMQWPLKRGAAVPHFSNVFNDQQYSAYLAD
ncbi:MAG: hypothetical protein K9M54_01165 [Kiritimatiellales bacterium]|nr:hypothetical protein [Kiritimatiellales bacterium]MCF7863228.1 hypothetical protein [Kiritimatiellales bacterium]